MKAKVTKLFLGPVLFSLAALAHSGAIAAQPLENQCRAAVRAEMLGPHCRVATPAYDDQCAYQYPSGMMHYVNRVIECVNRGGPERRVR